MKSGGMLGLWMALVATVFAEETTMLMPGVMPEKETYVCTSMPLDPETEHYLIGYKPQVGEKNAHHILLFGCEEPGSDEPVWDCGEMTHLADGMKRYPTCKSNPAILYAWAHSATELKLPEGVGFKVGGRSGINYLVMQLHYNRDNELPDHSGVTITHTTTPQPKTAATMLMVTGGVLPAKSYESFETACVIEEDVTIHPFAFRTHAHDHGYDTSGWLVDEDENGQDHWYLIGRRNPQLPQIFAPVHNKTLTVSQGQMIAARCLMKNDENRNIPMGQTGADEMCNYYMMYWVDGDRVLQDNTCYSPGAPYYHWATEGGLNHIPK
ncbi:unnamed protein product [Cylicocyclus nassatus]|uniref:peptidylglycine monooxygenase n=1 Tax=Cylicocyclus nassatus TaxID=53992 RepID=A0AA36DU75_CYLNA|nr:unnamed protein product [Cylicocyclus nassatus]